MGMYASMQKQIHQPFLYRYLKCEELHKIARCDAELRNTPGMFGVLLSYAFLLPLRDYV
jgi:hypothetical protein